MVYRLVLMRVCFACVNPRCQVLASVEGDRGSAEAAALAREDELVGLSRALSDAHATIQLLHNRRVARGTAPGPAGALDWAAFAAHDRLINGRNTRPCVSGNTRNFTQAQPARF